MTQALHRLRLKVFPGKVKSESAGKAHYLSLYLMPVHHRDSAGNVFLSGGYQSHVMFSAAD